MLGPVQAPNWLSRFANAQVLTMKPGEVQGYEEAIKEKSLMWQV
jgi:hypothetical protein